MTLPSILAAGHEEDAAELLSAYYRRLEDRRPSFTGSYFNSWAGGDTKDKDSITADDLVAVSFLSVDISAEAAIGILDTHREKISRLLARIPSDRDLAGVSPSEFPEILGEGSPASQLWHVLRGRDTGRWGIGETTASKIVARKRPGLIPIYDSVVGPLMGLKDSRGQWAAWHTAFVEDSGLSPRLATIRRLSGVTDEVSDILVMDIVLSMYGKQTAKPLAERNA